MIVLGITISERSMITKGMLLILGLMPFIIIGLEIYIIVYKARKKSFPEKGVFTLMGIVTAYLFFLAGLYLYALHSFWAGMRAN